MTNSRVRGGNESLPRCLYPPAVPPAVVAVLTAQVQSMVEESGNSDGFDAKTWLQDWLRSPLSALGGDCPVDHLCTPEGVDLISRMLASAQSGAYW
ncbi:MbcA/ParS/Xre antitoxin family protein [Burkholderia cepacia]|uniref:MbcA/ParS/Xre antitoxin family protein n=2 Tax=Burkholderia cepacia TaxID=292 RepID=UPI001C935B03|nr:MbcA/ParS/Xre antitoxin family protein [Burkholderia cepacia]MBY4714897.1 MbcA/ParS/Xre antitoxin family protein [Burkholderia cepacia]MBY4739004.1 MbcA/ParS/Xre antitoxin family protein [Burkholderia cepacia]MBY4744075.1 MbcA/ParS/Xre antitoxin family protein [Burkholderia cepacia]MBY4757060.1 MbcA/ParS/Xre antitoxin family protein [Burkholderia cepacia]MBY4777082.1 MbcA/ParS/Xre antitoxin family protein [Burkholderia cepacia]